MSKGKVEKVTVVDFLINNSKKIMIVLVVVSILVSLLLVGAWWITGGGNVVARVGNKKITKSEYDDFKGKCEKFYGYASDGKKEKECSQTELEDLILRKALENEAESRDITVSDAEINKKYTALAEPYGSEAAYLATIQKDFGYTSEYVKSNIKRDILKEKLEPYLLRKENVVGMTVRYDWTGDEKDFDKNSLLAKDKLEKEFYPMLKKGATPEEMGKKINEVTKRDGDPWNQEPVIVLSPINNLNEGTAQTTFQGKEDWQAISKLKNKGDVTKVIKSSGGYMVAYRLENMTSGSFVTWGDYKQYIIAKAKKYSFGYDLSILKKSLTLKTQNILAKAEGLVGIRGAEAACQAGHFSQMNGYVVDASNTSHGIVANVHLWPGNVGTWPKCSPQEGGDITVQSNYNAAWGGPGDGFLQLGWVNDPAKQYLSCFVRWHVDIYKTGFYTVSYRNRSTSGNGWSTNLDKPLGYAGKCCETYSGAYEAENTNDNGVIYLAPLPSSPPTTPPTAPPGTPPPETAPPTTATPCVFKVNNSSAVTVSMGSSVNLSWSNASTAKKVGRRAVSNGNDLGDIGVTGDHITVTPLESTTYTLKNASGNAISGCGMPNVTVIRNTTGTVGPIAP